MVLLIVINDEKPEDEQSGENAARDFRGGMKVPQSARVSRDEEKGSGKHMPPAFGGGVVRVGLCGEDQFRTRPGGGCRFERESR